MTTRLEQFKKFRASDIFNTDANNFRSQSTVVENKNRNINQMTLENTKSNILNCETKKDSNNYICLKKNNKFLKYYKSNIFSNDKQELRTKVLDKKKNEPSVFDSMKNNEQYKNDIKNYTIQHRPKMEPYNPDKYYGNEKATDRYYTQIVKGSIEKDKNNDEFNKNKKLYSLRKKEINKHLTIKTINDKNKDYRKKKVNWNNSDGRKYIEPKKNFINTSKINYYINTQSNIFNNNVFNDTYINNLENKYNNIKTENNINSNEQDNNINNDMNQKNDKEIKNKKELELKASIRELKKKLNENSLKTIKKNIKSLSKKKFHINRNKTMSNFHNKPLIQNSIQEKDLNNKDKKPLNTINIQKYKDYNEHNYILTYSLKKNDFEKFKENDIKEIFGKRGIHVYDVKKNQFDNGLYNSFKFRIRENEGEKNLKKKLKAVQNDLFKKHYLVSIKEGEIPSYKKHNLVKKLNSNKKENIQKVKKPQVNTRKLKISDKYIQINYKYKNEYIYKK